MPNHLLALLSPLILLPPVSTLAVDLAGGVQAPGAAGTYAFISIKVTATMVGLSL